LLLLVVGLFFLNGCAILAIPFKIIGGVFKLIGPVMDAAKKVPWWMWL